MKGASDFRSRHGGRVLAVFTRWDVKIWSAISTQLCVAVHQQKEGKSLYVVLQTYLKSSSTDFLCGSLNGHHHLHGDEFYGSNLVGKGRTGGLLGTCRLCRPHEESCQGWFVPWGLLFSKLLISALGSVLWPSPFCGGPHGVGLHFLVPPLHHCLRWRLGFSARPGEFLPTNWMNDLLTHAACGRSPLQAICENALFLFVGYDE